jgi:fatty acid desaturase
MTASARVANQEYVELKKIIKSSGLLEPSHTYYVAKSIVAFGTIAASVFLTIWLSNPIWILTSAVFMGFASTQTALLAHDVGHRQSYRGKRLNTLGRVLFGNILLCVSHTWWNDKHNQHHATPNHIDDDPDIRLPFVVISPEQIAKRPRLLRPLLTIQGFLFPLMLPLQSLSMRITSVQHLLRGESKRPWMEAAFMALHVVLYGAILWTFGSIWIAAAFVVIHQATFSLYNSTVFASNHKGMALIRPDQRLGFFREQVLTSRNIRKGPIVDFLYGGLNYQVEHHLFPTMPRNNLSKSQPIIRQFCEERGIPFHVTGVIQCYREIFENFQRVGSAQEPTMPSPSMAPVGEQP